MLTKEILKEIAFTKMPFGKFKDRYLSDIPEEYYIWFSRKGFPEGKLGELMAFTFELKQIGTTHLLKQIREIERKSNDS